MTFQNTLKNMVLYFSIGLSNSFSMEPAPIESSKNQITTPSLTKKEYNLKYALISALQNPAALGETAIPLNENCHNHIMSYLVGLGYYPCINFTQQMIPNFSFVNSNLCYADFSQTILTGINFTGANLCGADFYNATLNDTIFTNTTFKQAIFIETFFCNVNFKNATLTETYFQGAKITNTDFTGATLTKLNFKESTLNGVTFKGATLTKIKFKKKNMTDVDFTGETITSTDHGIIPRWNKEFSLPKIPEDNCVIS